MTNLLFATLLAVGVAGLGRLALRRLGITYRDSVEELCFALAVGWGGLILALLLLGFMGLLYQPVVCGLAGCIVLVGVLEFVSRAPGQLAVWEWLRRHSRSWTGALVVLATLGMALNLSRALAPPHGATDPLAYQLALPSLYLLQHGLSFHPTMNGALYPTNMGLLYVVALSLRDGSLAQALHWMMGAFTALAIFGFGRRYFTESAGIVGAVIFSLLPVVVFFVPLGYVDAGLCFYQFMTFWAVYSWTREGGSRRILLAAVIAGLSLGFKHQAIPGVCLVVLWVVIAQSLRRRDVVDGLVKGVAFGALALLFVAPWYLRAYYHSGNPVWPLANGLFDGLPWGQQFLPSREVLARVTVFPSKLAKLWDWTFAPSGMQYAVGGYFVALLPGLVFVVRRHKPAAFLAAFCAGYYLVTVLALHANPRYALFLLGFLSLLCGCVVAELDSSPWRVIRGGIRAVMLASVAIHVVWCYELAKPVLPVVTGRESRNAFLARHEPNYRMFQFINAELPDSARVLLQGIVKGFYCERDYLWDHPHQPIIQYGGMADPETLLRRLSELKVTHVARMINIPPIRRGLYPQYFASAFHEAFRQQYLELIYRDRDYVVFRVLYPK